MPPGIIRCAVIWLSHRTHRYRLRLLSIVRRLEIIVWRSLLLLLLEIGRIPMRGYSSCGGIDRI